MSSVQEDPPAVSNRNPDSLRRGVMLFFLPFLAANLLLGSLVMREVPESFPLETRLPALYGMLIAGCFFWLLKQPAATRSVGHLVASVIVLFFLGRIYSLVTGPALKDPSFSVFMPLYAYLPFAYFSMYVLLPAHSARLFSLGFWGSVVLIVFVHLAPHWSALADRQGASSLVLYLLLANPMFIVMLELIARMDRQVQRTMEHLVGARQEIELRRQIERHGERFKRAIMGSRDGLWEWPDMQQSLMWWSERTFELLRLNPLQHKADTELFLSRVHPEDAEVIRNAIRRAAAHENEDLQLEFRLLRGDGEYVWFAVSAVTVAGNVNGKLRMAGSIRNIHQQKEAELELLQSNKTLEEFARVAAHDLRSPLNRITMTAGLVKRRRPELTEDPDASRLFEMIDRQTGYMNELITSLLNFARADQKHEPVRVELGEVLAAVRDMYEAECSRLNARIEIGALPAAHASKVDMIRLFQNLIGNALKFNEGEPHIQVQGEQHGAFVEISVLDNGIGIPEDKLDEVLIPMTRLHHQSEYPGHGLGLAAVDNIVRKSGGRLRVRSSVGKGTEIQITLLAAHDADPVAQNAT